MARKNVHSHKMLDAVSMATSQTSVPTSVLYQDKAGIFVEWSGGGSPVGTVTVEARNAPNGTWYELDFGSTINVTGNSGSHHISINELPFQDIRIKYNRTSGSATMTATIVIKQVGG